MKGHQGESCREAIRKSITEKDVLSFTELYDRVKKLGGWKDETIWQHLMMLIVNLPPAKYHWNVRQPFLFLRPDGQYELYDERKHPKVIE